MSYVDKFLPKQKTGDEFFMSNRTETVRQKEDKKLTSGSAFRLHNVRYFVLKNVGTTFL